MSEQNNSSTLTQLYSISLIQGTIKKAEALKPLNHKLLKGEITELFISDILKEFLTSQFDIGSGIIVNQKGVQSKQTDIIIYDRRILPPFMKEQHLAIFPAEVVLATIEVKTKLTKADIDKAEEDAEFLYTNVYSPKGSIYPEFSKYKPFCTVVGFFGKGPSDLSDKKSGKQWFNNNRILNLRSLLLFNRFSWLRFDREVKNLSQRKIIHDWVGQIESQESCQEATRFFAVLLDNIRTMAYMREAFLSHRDWLGQYMRIQK